MGIAVRMVCDICGRESTHGELYLAILKLCVAEVPEPPISGTIIVDLASVDAHEITVCGQECYHKWHARRLAEYFEPKREVQGCENTHELSQGTA